MSLLATDVELVDECDVILSVVPPRDAVDTAQRVIDALSGGARKGKREAPLYFVDMNAVAPSTCKGIARLFERSGVAARFVDAAIIGGPPALKQVPASSERGEPHKENEWHLPQIPSSGPHPLSSAPGFGTELAQALAMRHIGDAVGAASGLKMCFASMTKGYTAIAIQAYTTAERLGVLGELRGAVGAMDPARLARTEGQLVAMAPKAYRWVREMEEISKTHVEEGGFEPFLFQGAAGVYRTVADDTVLGQEKVGRRKRGATAEDVASAMAEGLERKRKKNE